MSRRRNPRRDVLADRVADSFLEADLRTQVQVDEITAAYLSYGSIDAAARRLAMAD